MSKLLQALRAAIYGRQSKDKTKSIDEQTAECETDAMAEGWTISERYSDGVSASRFAKKARTGWPQLIADVEAGRLDVLVLWESSRGDRDAETWLGLLRRCREHNVLIRVTSHNHTYNMSNARDWRTLAEDGVDNAYESEKTSMRLRRATAAQAAAGKPHGRVRYGYERVYEVDDRGRRVLIAEREHPVQGPIVKEIVRRIGANEPVTVVIADLEKRGVPAPAGGGWTSRTLRAIATSEAYVGRRIHETTVQGKRTREVHPAMWDPVVTEEDHRAAVRVLSDPKRKTTKPGHQKWLLSYLARCGVGDCDRTVHRVPHHSGNPELARYACSKGCTSIHAGDLDGFVSEVACRYMAKNRLALRRGDDAAAQSASAEAEKLQARLDEWRDSGARGETSPASLARIEARLSNEITELQRGAVGATVPTVFVNLLAGARSYKEIRARFDALPTAAQREAIALVADIRVSRAQPGRPRFDPERLGRSRWVGDDRTWSEI